MRKLRGQNGLKVAESAGDRLTAAEVETIANAFGPLPQSGRKRLVIYVVSAVERYWYLRAAKEAPDSDRERHFRDIARASSRLLRLVRAEPLRRRPDADRKNLVEEAQRRLGRQCARAVLAHADQDHDLGRLLEHLAS